MAKHSNKTILVTGATGKQGGAVLRRLRERRFTVRALTRDPSKPAARELVGAGTEVVGGDFNDQASLTRALEGVYGVFSVQSRGEHSVDPEIRQGINLAETARRSNVRYFVYSSVASADQKTGIPFFDSKARIEEHVRSTGLRYTILRPAFFMENWLGMRAMIEQGTLALPLSPDTRLQMIAVEDIGSFTALAFEHPGHWEGRAVDIAGEELSMTGLAEAFTRMTGREVRYRQVPWNEFELQAGRDYMTMYRWLEEKGFHIDIPALRQENPNMTTFEKWLHSKWLKSSAA